MNEFYSLYDETVFSGVGPEEDPLPEKNEFYSLYDEEEEERRKRLEAEALARQEQSLGADLLPMGGELFGMMPEFQSTPPDPGFFSGLGAEIADRTLGSMQGAAEGIAQLGPMVGSLGRMGSVVDPALQIFTDPLERVLTPIGETIAAPFQESAYRLETSPGGELMEQTAEDARANAGFARTLAMDVAGMAPQLGVAALGGPQLGIPSMFLPAAGEDFMAREQAGMDPEMAARGAVLSGAVEAVTENLSFGTVSRLADLIDGPSIQTLAQLGKAVVSNGGQGALEEMTAQLGQELINFGVVPGGPPASWETVQEALKRTGYAGLVGFFGEAGAAAPTAAINYSARETGAPPIPAAAPEPVRVAGEGKITLDPATREFIAEGERAQAAQAQPAAEAPTGDVSDLTVDDVIAVLQDQNFTDDQIFGLVENYIEAPARAAGLTADEYLKTAKLESFIFGDPDSTVEPDEGAPLESEELRAAKAETKEAIVRSKDEVRAIADQVLRDKGVDIPYFEKKKAKAASEIKFLEEQLKNKRLGEKKRRRFKNQIKRLEATMRGADEDIARLGVGKEARVRLGNRTPILDRGKNERGRQMEEIVMEGFAAYQAGKVAFDNPYDPKSQREASEAWLNGYDAAADDEGGTSREPDEEAPEILNRMAPVKEREKGPKSPLWYSKLREAVEQKMGPKADAEQLVKMLENSGIKREEIDYSGLRELKGPVTREQVMETLDENAIEVQEKKLGEPIGLDDSRWRVKDGIWEMEAADGGVFSIMDGRDGRGYLLQSPSGYVSEYPTLEEAMRRAGGSQDDPTQFNEPNLRTPGGKNYRELLLTLPSKMRERKPGEPLGSNHREIFIGSHWREPNVLAHVRFDERTDADGKKVLFIDEIQSDLHQRGRKEGYKRKIGGKTGPEWAAIAERMFQDAKAANDGRYVGDRMDALFDDPVYQEAHRNAKELKGGSIPDFPFKQNWPELALKRIMRYAADNGFERIAWTTGEQQRKRYPNALRAVADSIKWSPPDAAGDKRVSISKGKDTVVEASIGSEGHVLSGKFIGDRLEDVIGKPMAKQVLSEAGGEILGREFVVGGSGMDVFYDQVLPSAAEKLGKKYGVKVGKTRTADTESRSDAAAFVEENMENELTDAIGSDPDWFGGNSGARNAAKAILRSWDSGGRESALQILHQDDVEAYDERLSGIDPQLEVHSMDVSPEMSEPMALYREQGERAVGSIRFDKETGKAAIRILSGETAQEAVEEELAHLFRRAMPESLRQAAKKAMGMSKDGTWTREKEELFAKRMLLYTKSKQNPPPAWERVVRLFREWLVDLREWAGGQMREDQMSRSARQFFDKAIGPKAQKPGPESQRGRQNLDRAAPRVLESRPGYTQSVNAAKPRTQGGRPGIVKRSLTTFGKAGQVVGRLEERKREEIATEAMKASSAGVAMEKAIRAEVKAGKASTNDVKQGVNDYLDAELSDDQVKALEQYEQAKTPADQEKAWKAYLAAPDSAERQAAEAALSPKVARIAKLMRREIDELSRKQLDRQAGGLMSKDTAKRILLGDEGMSDRTVGIGRYSTRTFRIHREGQKYIDEIKESARWHTLKPEIQQTVLGTTTNHVVAVHNATHKKNPLTPAQVQQIRDAITKKDPSLVAGLKLHSRLVERIRIAGMHYNDVEAFMMNQLLERSPDKPTSVQPKGAGAGTIDPGIYKKRGEIPKPLRELYGEDIDPIVRFLNTTAAINRNLATFDMYEGILAMGLSEGWVVEGAPSSKNAPEGMVEMPGPAQRAPLGGARETNTKYFVPKHIAEALLESEAAFDEKWYQELFSKASWITKSAMTIWTEPVHWRNAISNVLLVAATGNWHAAVSIARAWKGLVGIESGKKVLKAAGKGVGNLTLDDILGEGLEAKRYGVLGSNIDLGIIRSIQERGMTPHDVPKSKLVRGARAAHAKASWMYQFEDNLPKLATWIAERQRLKLINPTWSERKIKEVAAENVKNLLPNYSRMVGVARSASKNRVVSPFVGFISEIPRNVLKTLELAGKEIATGVETKNAASVASGIQRIASVSMAIAAAKTATTFVLTGIASMLGYDVLDDDETEDLRGALPFYQRNSEVIAFRKKDDKSKIHVLDFSFMDGWSVLKKPIRAYLSASGDRDDRFMAALQQAAESYLGLEILTELGLDIARGETAGGRTIRPKNAKWTWQVLLSAQEAAQRTVMAPARPFINPAMGYFGIQGDNGRVYDTKFELLNLVGPRVFTWSNEELANIAAREYVNTVRVGQSYKSQAKRITKGKITLPTTKAKGAGLRSGEEGSYREAAKRLSDAVGALRTTGMDDDEISAILKDAGISYQDAQAALEGYEALREAAESPSRPRWPDEDEEED